MNSDTFFLALACLPAAVVIIGLFVLWLNREPCSKPAPAKSCDSCGESLPMVAQFCRRCGKQLIGVGYKTCTPKLEVDFGNKRDRHTQWAAMADALNRISLKSSGATICIKDEKISTPAIRGTKEGFCRVCGGDNGLDNSGMPCKFCSEFDASGRCVAFHGQVA